MFFNEPVQQVQCKLRSDFNIFLPVEPHKMFDGFDLPAVAHCGGSTGPSSIGGGMPEPPAAYRDADHHAVSAVIKWVEQGVAPEKIIATRFTGGNLTLSRPLCPYPAQAVYSGTGYVNDAANFSCAAQIEQAANITPGDIVQIKNAMVQRGIYLPNR